MDNWVECWILINNRDCIDNSNLKNKKDMKYKLIILAGLIVGLFGACSEDFLDKPSQEALTTAVYFKTQVDFEGCCKWNIFTTSGFL